MQTPLATLSATSSAALTLECRTTVHLPALPWYCRGNRNAVRRQDALFIGRRPSAAYRRIQPSPILAGRLALVQRIGDAAYRRAYCTDHQPHAAVSATALPVKTRDWSTAVNSLATLALLVAIVLICASLTHIAR